VNEYLGLARRSGQIGGTRECNEPAVRRHGGVGRVPVARYAAIRDARERRHEPACDVDDIDTAHVGGADQHPGNGTALERDDAAVPGPDPFEPSREVADHTADVSLGVVASEGAHRLLQVALVDVEEDASLEPDSPADRSLRGVVELREALGSELMVHFTVEGTREALTEDVKELAQDAGAPAQGPVLESTGSGALLVGRFSARANVAEGKPVEVAVDTRSLHFFDEETSEGIYDGTGNDGNGGST